MQRLLLRLAGSRRLTLVTCVVATATSFFALGAIHTRRLDAAVNASYEARLDSLRDEMQRALARESSARAVPTGTRGTAASAPVIADDGSAASRAQMVAEVKEQLRSEMGLLPVSLLRERRSSFVEVHTYDSDGEKNYATAGYLGRGYFITVKHVVVALHDGAPGPDERKITALRIVYRNKEIPARLVDAGNARMEVDKGDWAIIRTRELDLPPLRVDTAFPYEFAEPIFRLGNDYSRGIVVSTGYVGQKTDNGLVTCLTDGHPGVSGGGVLDQRGTLVGISIGRMGGDYRFSFILPIRPEMLRQVPPDAGGTEALEAAP
jgi:trypsin-like peptidase